MFSVHLAAQKDLFVSSSHFTLGNSSIRETLNTQWFGNEAAHSFKCDCA